MIKIDIPDFGNLCLEKLVLDFNGTIANDGLLLPGIAESLALLKDQLDIHVVTADTYGTAQKQVAGFAGVKILRTSNHTAEKAEFVRTLGASKVIAAGNGRNDAMMLKEAAVGVLVLQNEGASAFALQNADIVVKDIADVFSLLKLPKRLVATLRG